MFPKLLFIDSYAVMIFLGLVAAFALLEGYAAYIKANRLKLSYIELSAAISILIGFVGALLFENLYEFIKYGSEYSWTNSMTFFGGLITGVACFALLYAFWLRKGSKGTLASMLPIAPACLAAAHGFGRIGCFLAGCCYGTPTSSWIGVTFPGVDGAVVPTNLIEAIFLLLLSAALAIVAFKRKSPITVPIYMVCYGAFRFVIEFYRGDERGSLIPGISPSQLWAILLLAIGAGLLISYIVRISRRNRNP